MNDFWYWELHWLRIAYYRSQTVWSVKRGKGYIVFNLGHWEVVVVN